jgi:hypothetical protein
MSAAPYGTQGSKTRLEVTNSDKSNDTEIIMVTKSF